MAKTAESDVSFRRLRSLGATSIDYMGPGFGGRAHRVSQQATTSHGLTALEAD